MKDTLSTHKNQELTGQNAVPVAKDNRSEVVIHGRDGNIRDKDSYGNDPCPSRDKKHKDFKNLWGTASRSERTKRRRL